MKTFMQQFFKHIWQHRSLIARVGKPMYCTILQT